MLELQQGRVYRTREFVHIDSNATRLVAKLVKRGRLTRLRKGLYYVPASGTFGEVPPSEDALLQGYFGRSPFLRTGPVVWNALGLGSTAVEAVPLVYNTKLTGQVELGGRRFEFRRVRFPQNPPAEYFVVDLLGHTGRAGVDRTETLELLVGAVQRGWFDAERLRNMARRFGTKKTQEGVAAAISLASGDR